MKKYLGVFLTGLLCCLLVAAPSFAAPLTRGPVVPPKIEKPGDKLGKKTTLFMPQKLIIYNFSFDVVSWDPGSSLDNGAGWGHAKFNTTASDSFSFRFTNVKVVYVTPGNKTLGRITDGKIFLDFNPGINITMGTLTGKVSKLHLMARPDGAAEIPPKTAEPGNYPLKGTDPQKPEGNGINQVSMKVLLPTLWTRTKLPDNTYTSAKQAYLYFSDLDTTQDLDIFLPDYKDHQLNEVGIGDTNIIMDCTNKPLIVDLSVNQPANLPKIPPQLTGVVFDQIKTIPQPERQNSNIGFCFGEYLLSGGLNQNGLLAKLVLQKNFTYQSSIPLGYEITLDSGFTEGLPINQSQTSSGGSGQSAPQSQLTLLQGDGSELSQGLQINPNGGSGSGIPQNKLETANNCTLTLAKSAVLGGKLVAKVILPESVSAELTSRVVCNAQNLIVDAGLNTSGEAFNNQSIFWGKCQDNPKNNFFIQTDIPAQCYFPGTAGTKPDLTIDSGGAETFDCPDDVKEIPGITFFSFNLTVRTKDANGKELYFPFEKEFVKQGNGVYQIAGGVKQMRRFWLNVGTSGIGGTIQVDSRLAYDNGDPQKPSYPVDLGNPNPEDNQLVMLGAYQPFKAFFHSNGSVKNLKPDGQPTDHDKNDMTRAFSQFFQATFVDNAVFDFGVDGHFQVGGPSNIFAQIDDLSATSTAELCSATVSVDAKLDYWGVGLKTKNSKLAPKATKVFFLGATIDELSHYDSPFPVVWGQMASSGNIQELLFGYAYQTFDRLAYNYRDVHLSKYTLPDDKNGKRGALVTEGDVFFAYFGPQQMTIEDYNNCTPNLDSIFEGRQIGIIIAKNEQNYFSINKTWGPGKMVKNQPIDTVTFDFPKVRYVDGAENEDGFAQFENKDLPKTEWGTIEARDIKNKISSGIHITGAGSQIIIPGDDTPHLLLADDQKDQNQNDPNQNDPNENKKTILTQIWTDPDEPFIFTSDTLPEFKLLGKFDPSTPVLGGFTDPYAIIVKPEATEYRINQPVNSSPSPPPPQSPSPQSNKTEVSVDVNIPAGPVEIKGKARVVVILKDELVSGDIFFDEFAFQAAAFGGHGSGGFGVAIGKDVKYIQGYGTITIVGIPWPAPNSGGGAFFLGYGASLADIYALDYLDRGTLEASMIKGLGQLPKKVKGFYLACKVGYNYSIGGLGEVYVYFAGGTGIFNSYLLLQTGVEVGVDICGIGLESSTYITGGADFNNKDSVNLVGKLHYQLSLLFFDYCWDGWVTLTPDGISSN